MPGSWCAHPYGDHLSVVPVGRCAIGRRVQLTHSFRNPCPDPARMLVVTTPDAIELIIRMPEGLREVGLTNRRHRVAQSMQWSSAFTGFRFPPEVVMLAVRWYLRSGSRTEISKNSSPNAASPSITSRCTAGCNASLPCSSTPRDDQGTRHRTAKRVANSIDAPVIAVSEEMGVINLYVGGRKHQLQAVSLLLDRANQALQTLERYKVRLDDVRTTRWPISPRWRSKTS